jgi:hypothetical protein
MSVLGETARASGLSRVEAGSENHQLVDEGICDAPRPRDLRTCIIEERLMKQRQAWIKPGLVRDERVEALANVALPAGHRCDIDYFATLVNVTPP